MSESVRTNAFSGTYPAIHNRPGASLASGHRFNKACDSCHISKVRCMPDVQSPIGTCKRCSKNGTSCIFSPVGPRRRPVRSKNDRIAELERRVKDMQIKLEKQVEKRSGTIDQPDASKLEPISSGQPSGQPSESWPTSTSETGSGLEPEPSTESSGIVPRTRDVVSTKPSTNDAVIEGSRHQTLPGSTISTPPTLPSTPVPAPKEEPDVIDQGLLTEAQADQLIHIFRSVLNGKYLGIRLPNAISNSQLRQSRPAFWLSILCAASAGSAELVHLAPVLFSQLKTILDRRITPESKPDLDALQALTSWAIFHNDPVFPLGADVVEKNSLAIQMATKMAEVSRLHVLPADTNILADDVSEADVQLSRELLHWYWASFSLAFKRRQPDTLLRQTHLVEASLRILRIAHDQNDARLLQWIKLVKIAAEAVLALKDGHSQQADGLSGEARDSILESFEKQRKQWLVDCPFHLVNEPLMLEYHSLVILLSEVIYPAGVADFSQRSYGLPSLSLSSTGNAPVPDRNFFAPYKIRFTRKSIAAAHACLDIATGPANSGDDSINSDLSPSTDLLRCYGCFLHARVFYALRLLLSVAHEAWRTKKYDIIDVDTLKIDAYIVALRTRLEAVSEKGRYRVPSLWLNALQAKIEPWWQALRRLLERDRPIKRDMSLEEETLMCPLSAAHPSQQGTVPLGSQQAAASRASNLVDTPLSPSLPDFLFDLFTSDPLPAALFDDMMSGFKDFLGPMTAMPCESFESGLQKVAVPEHVSPMGSLRQHTSIPPSPAAIHTADDSRGGRGTENDELDPLAFDWGNLSEYMPSLDMSFSPPYLHTEALALGATRDQGDSSN